MLWVFQVMPLHFSHLLRIPFQFSLGKSVHLNHPERVHLDDLFVVQDVSHYPGNIFR